MLDYYFDSDSENDYDDILNKIFLDKYHCIRKIGQGSFGRIYEAVYKNEKYALKFEPRKSEHNLLQNEAAIMNYLQGPNIPSVKSFGFTTNYNILVMQLLGKSLEQLLEERKTFSLKTVCMLGYQMVTILEFIHEKHLLHRDVKPDNFAMGLDEFADNIYLIDFGLSKKYRSMKTLEQYPCVQNKQLTGTARYASINVLKGLEHSRRDDLESVGYILIYFLKGKLPWQKMNAKTREEKYKKILEKKLQISSKELYQGYPNEFVQFLDYIKNLDYYEKPNYDILRHLLNNVMQKQKYMFDYVYDWSSSMENLKRNIKNKMEQTNWASFMYHETEKKYPNINDENDNIYHIKRNNKIFENYVKEEPVFCNSSACSIF